jgi:hypothetical protein
MHISDIHWSSHASGMFFLKWVKYLDRVLIWIIPFLYVYRSYHEPNMFSLKCVEYFNRILVWIIPFQYIFPSFPELDVSSKVSRIFKQNSSKKYSLLIYLSIIWRSRFFPADIRKIFGENPPQNCSFAV